MSKRIPSGPVCVFVSVLMFVFVLVIAAFAAGCGCDEGTSADAPGARTGKATKPADPVPVDIGDIKNARRTGELLFGGQPSPETIQRLAEEGYKTIVSTRGTGELSWDEKAAVETAGMSFVFIAMDKPLETITDAQVAAFD